VALKLGVGPADRGCQVAAVAQVRGDQVRDHLGVGLAREDGALAAQPLAQRQVVLDDAVHDDVNAVGRVEVRVRVLLVDAAVRGPAGVTDADRRLTRHGRDRRVAVAPA